MTAINVTVEQPSEEDLDYFRSCGALTSSSLSRNKKWAVLRVGPGRALVLHEKSFHHTLLMRRAPVEFAVSNDGFVGFDFGEPNLPASRMVVVSPDGHQIFNKKVNTGIIRLGVTHDEKVIWFETGCSEKTKAHDLKCFAVHLEQAKLIYSSERFRGEPIDSGVRIHERWGPRLYFKLELEEWLYIK